MDDGAALHARRVAAAGSAWMREPNDARVHGPLVHAWDFYVSPLLDDAEEVLDAIADRHPPQPLGPAWRPSRPGSAVGGSEG